MTREQTYFFLSMILSEGVGFQEVKGLLEAVQDPEELFSYRARDLYALGVPVSPFLFATFEKCRDEDRIFRAWEEMEEKKIRYITREDPAFPEKLLSIQAAPFGLFVNGRLPDPAAPTVAMIGARQCSNYGKEMAFEFGRVLAEHGVVVISGMALGVDGYAMRGAIQGGGESYGVLAGGADLCYPMENIGLYNDLVHRFGVISERICGTRALPLYFPLRNRLVSGLSDGVLVIEAALRSGTSITVSYALEQNREVFALPGRVGDRLSEGCNHLIKSGAQVLTSPDDVLQALKIHSKSRPLRKKRQSLLKEEKSIYDLLKGEPKDVETLLNLSGFPASALLQVLLQLEMKDYVRREEGGTYRRNI